MDQVFHARRERRVAGRVVAMAMLNFTISYTAKWQGWAIERFGYPVTLGMDAALGMAVEMINGTSAFGRLRSFQG